MKVMNYWIVVMVLGLGCGLFTLHAQEDRPLDGGMPPMPPPMMNGGMGPQKGDFHRGEEFRRIWEKLKKEKPEEMARLEKLKHTNREEYYRELRKLYPAHVRIPNMTMKLDQQCWELGRQYRIARTEEEKKAILKELNEMVEKSFEAMVQDAKNRLEMLEKQLEEMEKNKEEINKKRLDMFLKDRRNGGFGGDGEGKGPGWRHRPPMKPDAPMHGPAPEGGNDR